VRTIRTNNARVGDGLRFLDFHWLATTHRLRLEGTTRGGAEIVVLEAELRHLKAAYAKDKALKDAIDSVNGKDKFDVDVA
jgi:hypothetical protein